ncbi:MAG: hypothetical protein H6641_05050 [Caldilineaceae bacterium]|nr:hypothetical protein [Caldilineaceae bacterium]
MNDSHQMGLGSAEIRVFFNEIVYAAPNLIYHYVIVHAYKPPDAFIEAVLRGFLPQTSEYDELINRLGVDYRFISFD